MQVGRALKRARMAAPRKKLLWLMWSSCKNFVDQYLLPYLGPWTKRITLKTHNEKSRRSAPLRRNLLRIGICSCYWEPSATQGESGGAYSGDAADLLYRYGPLFLASILSLCYLPLHAVVVGKGHGRTSEFMSGRAEP